MDESSVASVERLEQSDFPNMIWIPGGTFRMGSDKHYPEEAPAHRVTVGGFWIDRTPVTNRQFKQFVRATGHKTLAEIPPDPKNYPGALPHMLYAGSLVFTPPHRPVDLKNFGEWWAYRRVLTGAIPTGRRATSTLWIITQLCMWRLLRCTRLRKMGGQGAADRGRMGIRRPRWPRRRRVRLGQRIHSRRPALRQYLAGKLPERKSLRGWF